MNEDLLYGYESPIKVMMTDEIVKRLHDEIDREVFRVIQRYGISVDKDELIKALQYDRGQYEKGFLDGRRCKPPIRTQADRIRAMTDEELARFIAYYGCPPNTNNCCPKEFAGEDETDCEACWLKWLKEEVKS